MELLVRDITRLGYAAARPLGHPLRGNGPCRAPVDTGPKGNRVRLPGGLSNVPVRLLGAPETKTVLPAIALQGATAQHDQRQNLSP